MERTLTEIRAIEEIPLLEFDSKPRALMDPSRHRKTGIPDNCVIPFYGKVVQRLKQEKRLEQVYEFGSVLTPIPVYKFDHDGRSVTVACPTGCGAPLAAALLEELIALGCCRFVACGSAGVLKSELGCGTVVVPGAAVRDEGTSYHYLPPSRTVALDRRVLNKLESVLKRHHVDYEIGLTWTIDAPYRETRAKIAGRKAEGCLVVEMECAAMAAVATFRKVQFGQYLLAGDDISGDEWDGRSWSEHSDAHEKVFALSVEACLSL
jgi:uridine phosphorylase